MTGKPGAVGAGPVTHICDVDLYDVHLANVSHRPLISPGCLNNSLIVDMGILRSSKKITAGEGIEKRLRIAAGIRIASWTVL